MSRAPAFQFYPADWLNDIKLQSCSLEAQGLLINLMCLMHQAKPYGFLMINNSIPTDKMVIKLLRLHHKTYQARLIELLLSGVLSKDGDGVIFCNRMVKDEQIREVRRKAGKLGGNPLLKQEVNQELKQKSTPSSSSSSSSSSSPSKTRLPKGNSSAKKNILPPCPHQKIINLYHEILPSLNHIQIWDDTSKKNLKKRWRENPKHQILNFWKTLFEYISESKFLMGEVKDWSVDLTWIVRPSNFAKIINGRYHKSEKNLTDAQRFTINSMEDFINE